MKTLGYGIIGCGRVSARHLDAAEQIEGARLVAVADRELEKARAVSNDRASQPAAFSDYRDLLGVAEVDVVVICLPTHLHADAAVAAARAGKHVFCEKAMAPTLRGCRDMMEAADTNGVKLTVGHSWRFFAPFQQARRLIDAGVVGDIVALDGSFCGKATLPGDVRDDFWRFQPGAQGHGYVVNFGCHYVDAARYLCGQDIRRVSAFIGNRFSEGQTPEDQFVITALCDKGALITIGFYASLRHVAVRNAGFVVYGTEGALEVYQNARALRLTPAGGEPVEVPIDEDLVATGPWMRFHRQFRQCIEDDGPPPVSGRDGAACVEWAVAAYLANERGVWMDLPLAPDCHGYGGPESQA